MTRLLATEHRAIATHGLEDVAVPHVGDLQRAAKRTQRMVCTEIRHARHDDAVARQRIACNCIGGEQREDVIAVDRIARGIDEEHAVGIAVERNAEIGTVLLDRGGDIAEMGGPAIDIDVAPVRLGRHQHGLGAEELEEAWRDGGCRAMGAVNDDPHACERDAGDRGNPLGIGLSGARGAVCGAHALTRRQVRVHLEERFDRLLLRVEQFVAVGAEQLDAVIGIGIVARADHDPRSSTALQDRPGDGGRRQDAETDGVAAGRGDARRQRVLEHRARAACIAPDQDHGRGLRRGQTQRGGTPDA